MAAYFLYNTLLNVGLMIMIFSMIAAYNSSHYLILVISLVFAGVLGYLKYRLLKRVRQQTKDR